MFVDPRQTNIFFDSCAFDGGSQDEQNYSRALCENKELRIMLAHSTTTEIACANTPQETQVRTEGLLRTSPVPLTLKEKELKEKISKILTGNGKRENMVKDSEHLFEACKYGSYFVTTDTRILKKKDEIYALGAACKIVLPSQLSELLELFREEETLCKQIEDLHAKRNTHDKSSDEYKKLDNASRELEEEYSKKWDEIYHAV